MQWLYFIVEKPPQHVLYSNIVDPLCECIDKKYCDDDKTDANEGWTMTKWHGDGENGDNDKTDANEGRGSGRSVIKDCKKFCIQRILHCHGFRICQAKYKHKYIHKYKYIHKIHI